MCQESGSFDGFCACRRLVCPGRRKPRHAREPAHFVGRCQRLQQCPAAQRTVRSLEEDEFLARGEMPQRFGYGGYHASVKIEELAGVKALALDHESKHLTSSCSRTESLGGKAPAFSQQPCWYQFAGGHPLPLNGLTAQCCASQPARRRIDLLTGGTRPPRSRCSRACPMIIGRPQCQRLTYLARKCATLVLQLCDQQAERSRQL